MFDKKRAAEYYVVGWCKNWTLRQYANVVAERESMTAYIEPEELAVVTAAFSWMPVSLADYVKGRSIRAHAEDSYPKLSAWLHGRTDDVKRLACAAQIEKLKDKGAWKASTHPGKDGATYRKAMFGASLISQSNKSQQRSAWNVCKG